MSKHTLVATVEEGPVVLNRVLSLFRQRSFAIESLSIGRTNEAGIMRLTMVVDGARSAVEQVTKQLYKVIEVRKVSDLSDDARVERELALDQSLLQSCAPTRRSDADRRYLSRPRCRRRQRLVDGRSDRADGQSRQPDRAVPPVRCQRTGPHRRCRDESRPGRGRRTDKVPAVSSQTGASSSTQHSVQYWRH